MRQQILMAGLAAFTMASPANLSAEVIAAAPGFGDGSSLSAVEQADLEQTAREAEAVIASVRKQAAEQRLEIGHWEEITGRLMARLDTMRRSSRTPEPAKKVELTANVFPLRDANSGSPGVCDLTPSDTSSRRFTMKARANLMESWTACTTLTGLPLTADAAGTIVHLTRRSSRSVRVKNEKMNFGPEIEVEANLLFSDLSAGLALVHDTARDLEAELPPSTRRHDQPF